MTTRLLMVRHGQSWDKVRNVVGGPKGCEGLTARGREEALRLRDRLAGLEGLAGAALYSSTLRRAVETAEILAAALGVEPRPHCGLCTYHVTELVDGLPRLEVRTRHGLPGGGAYRPYQSGVEAWAQL